jgi:hypothetical protein
METKSYINLRALAAKTGLPKGYIKELALSQKIPCLQVSGRLRFNPAAVQTELDRLAAKGGSNGNAA